MHKKDEIEKEEKKEEGDDHKIVQKEYIPEVNEGLNDRSQLADDTLPDELDGELLTSELSDQRYRDFLRSSGYGQIEENVEGVHR